MRGGTPAALRAAVVAAPLLLFLAPAAVTPRGLAFALTHGWWLIALGAAAGLAVIAAARAGRLPPPIWPGVEAALARMPMRLVFVVLAVLGFLSYREMLPAHRLYGPVAGDEPKYLRMAVSLCRDLDAEIAPSAEKPPRRREGATRLISETAAAMASLGRGESPPHDHRWLSGDFQDWAVRGWKGGEWYVHSLGLSALLAPAACLEERVGDAFAPGPLTFATLGLLWAIALVQTSRLAAEVSGSPLAGLVAGVTTAFSVPMFVGAWYVYPETAACAVVPWLTRYARSGGPPVGPGRVLALGLAAGSLPWLHVKYLLLAPVLAGLLLWRLARRSRLIAIAGFALPVLALLLFEYHVTGLLRPDARYLRHGSQVYEGPVSFLSPRIVVGAVNALFGARDGLLVMAPVLVAGVLSLPLLWRRDRRAALELTAVFASLLVVVSLHGGSAPGPAGRLLGPVACVPAAALAAGLAERRRWLPFRWSVIALALVSLAIVEPMTSDWRRVHNPWRSISGDANVSMQLPASPFADPAPRRWVLPSLVLGAILAFWTRVVGRSPAATGETPAAVEDGVVAVHLAWWSSIVVASAGLAAAAWWR